MTSPKATMSNPASVILLSAIAISLGFVGVTCAGDPIHEEIPIKYVKGTFEVPSAPTSLPVLYDSFVPLVYELELPKWDATTMKIQFYKEHNNCTTSDTYDDGYPCPIMHHYNKMVDEFMGNMTYWKSLFLPNDTDARLPLISKSKSLLQDTEFYCSRITPHFNAFQTTPEQLEEYLKIIGNCGDDTIKVSINLTETSVNLEDLYHTAFSTFATEYWEKLKLGPREASMVIAWTTLGSTLMLHQYMETQKWSSAISSCQNNQIPWTLITHASLKDAINSTSHVDNLSIPLDQITKYFRLPLTDCVFVGQEKLVVRILVPINIIDSGYRLIKFEPVVFHEEGSFCWIDGLQDKNFVVDFKDNLYVTECSDQGQNLCKTSDNFHSSQDKADPCAYAIYTDSEDEILESCPLKCRHAEKRPDGLKYFNIAYRTEDNFMYAAGDDDIDLKVECDGKTLQVIPKLDFGAWNITIPCGCKLTGFDDQMEYPVQAPCINQYILEKIRPYHWRHLSIPSTNDSGAGEDYIKNSTTTMTLQGEDLFIQRMDDRYGSLFTHQTLLWILNCILLILVGILSYFVYHLQKWRRDELYRENRLIYSVRGNDNEDDLSMERQSPRY